MDKKLIELIHEDLEGKLTPEEHHRLQERLTTDPEAATYYANWQKLGKDFEKSRNNLPDLQLTREVLHEIQAKSDRSSIPEAIFHPPFWQRQTVKFSFVFIAGLLLGFFVFLFLAPDIRTGSSHEEQMKGTLFGTRNTDQMKLADNLLYEAPGLRATFDVRYSGSMVEARVSLNCQSTVECMIDFNPSDFQPLNVTSANSDANSSFTASAGWVKMVSVGDNEYIVWLRNRNNLPNQIRIRLLSNGMTIYQNTVTVNKE